MESELKGNVALVTGGASGIGWACAQSFAREGYSVALWDVSADVEEKAAELHHHLSPDDWPRVLDVNIMAMVKVAHAATSAMIDRLDGAMIFLASVAGQIGSQTDPPCSASKAANINFAQCRKASVPMNSGEKTKCVRWRRWGVGNPREDVADMVVFLSSARVSHVTGQTINVGGGQVMHW